MLKTLNILAVYLSANFAIAPCSRDEIFLRDDNAIIAENCIAIAAKIARVVAAFKIFQYFRNFSEDVALPAQDMLHTEICR